MGHKDLRLKQIVYILVFYNISFSWLLHSTVSNLMFCCVTVKTIYNQVLDITNDFLYTNNSKYLRKNLNITKPLYSHQIFSVSWLPWPFNKSRFHCRRILRARMGGKFLKFELLKFKIRITFILEISNLFSKFRCAFILP